MPSEVILPRVDMDMATGKISKWLVQDGTSVRKGQPLFEIETDKAAMEIEAEAAGRIRTLAKAGSEDLAVGSVVAWIYRDGEAEQPVPTSAGAAPDQAAVPEPSPSAPVPHGSADATPSPTFPADPAADAERRARATPLARRLARERGLDLSVLVGSGPRGRVQAADVPMPGVAETVASQDARGIVPPSLAERTAIASGGPAPDVVSAVLSRKVSDTALALLREGDGTPVVLIHGFGSEMDAWRPFLQGYAGSRPVLALDLPGHGAAALGANPGFAALVDAVEATLLGSGLPALNLVGHSLGGAVATAIAARGVVDLRALLLLSPAGLGPDINGAFINGYLASSSEASLAPWLRELVAEPDVITPGFVRATLKARAAALDGQRRLAAALFPDGTQSFSIRAELDRVACPVRIVVGTADRIIRARHAESLPALVALHRLPGVGHLPHIEARATVQALLAQTVRS